ncbi:MAG: stressosome-associated protein Prli42 [Sporolactobacillus sp.]|nr:stressosome-associated protein Prli42 [Sporolactobacillus sp.]MCI1881494.1 stressosome-associated protein Prli42 [Sporolactobacillus sp.]
MRKKWFRFVIYLMIAALVLSTVAGMIAALVGGMAY